MPVADQADKQRLKRQVVSKKLSRKQIRQEVRQLERNRASPAQDKTSVALPEPGREQPLQRYGLIGPDRAARSKGTVAVDCGSLSTVVCYGLLCIVLQKLWPWGSC